MDNTTVLIFKSIACFISDLNQEFGSKYKSIALYNRLLEHTGITNVLPIKKHIDAFHAFFEENKKGMEEQNEDLFVKKQVGYSDRVFVDVACVLKKSNDETKQIIWQHLYTIWGLIDPTSQAKRLLHKNNGQPADKESRFLSDIIDKVEKNINTNEVDSKNPMAAVTSLMSSGVFTDLINDMQTGLSDGSLDISKLMGSVQGLMGRMGGGGNGNGGGMPDMSMMMNMVGGMMGGGMGGMGGMGGGNGNSSGGMGMLDKSDDKKE
jgi:hypothetical protein